MLKPYVYDISSPEIYDIFRKEKSYREWCPVNSNLDLRGINLNILVSFRDDNKTAINDFSIFLVNESNLRKSDIQHYVPTWVIKGDFKWSEVEKGINKFIENSIGNNYEECFDKIRERMWWEFDDYSDEDDFDLSSQKEIIKKQLTIVEDGVIVN